MTIYPFSAVVGHDDLRLALILCAVYPKIGGVLIRGEKGTAKSTLVRGLGQLLSGEEDPSPVIDLPLSATEDRVIGSIDLEAVLSEGRKVFTPGVLASADGGFLYVDEVNLLADHLVDVLLDAAAIGEVTVERDGISHKYPSNFVLVGTMNPEEGELRPQLVDRFGLAVDVAASKDIDDRSEVIARRLEFENSPSQFAGRFAEADRSLRARIRQAGADVRSVALPREAIKRIAQICAAYDIDGMRGDIVVARTAVAHAAWCGANEVTEADIRIAATLALPHRRRRDPFDDPDGGQSLQQALDDAYGGEPNPTESPSEGAMKNSGASSTDTPNAGEAPLPVYEPPPGVDSSDDSDPQKLSPVAVGSDRHQIALPKIPRVIQRRYGPDGRRLQGQSHRGRVVGSQAGDSAGGLSISSGLHVVDTVLAAACRAPSTPSTTDGSLRLVKEDLRFALRRGTHSALVVFVLDLSGSMAARQRLTAVTGACVSLLRDSYQKRDKVAVIAFRGSAAEVVLPPTDSVDVAVRRLRHLQSGGATPLADGLSTARRVVTHHQRCEPQRHCIVVVVTDGRATGSSRALDDAYRQARRLHATNAETIVVDCEQGFVRLGLAAELASIMSADVVTLDALSDGGVIDLMRGGPQCRRSDCGGAA